MTTTTKRVLVPIANGSEEIESVTIIDTLRRAHIEVIVAKVGGEDDNESNPLQIKASRGVYIVADTLIERVQNEQFDAIALPGGLPGAKAFAQSQILLSMLREQKKKANAYVTAICASPAIVLAPNGLLEGITNATCYPSMQKDLENGAPQCAFVDEKVVKSGNVITSQGPATSLDFALTLISVLINEDKAKEVAKGMLATSF